VEMAGLCLKVRPCWYIGVQWLLDSHKVEAS
jgi:hypothetical protein